MEQRPWRCFSFRILFLSNSKWNQIATVSTVLPSSGNWSTSGNNAGNYGGNATNLSIGTATYDDLIFKVNASNIGKLSVDGSISFGNSASSKYQSTAIGYNAVADNNEAAAVGKNAFSGGYRSLALGFAAKPTAIMKQQWAIIHLHQDKTLRHWVPELLQVGRILRQ